MAGGGGRISEKEKKGAKYGAILGLIAGIAGGIALAVLTQGISFLIILPLSGLVIGFMGGSIVGVCLNDCGACEGDNRASTTSSALNEETVSSLYSNSKINAKLGKSDLNLSKEQEQENKLSSEDPHPHKKRIKVKVRKHHKDSSFVKTNEVTSDSLPRRIM